MANARYYSNTAQQTTLSGSISSGTTTINVSSTTGFPPTTPYTLALDFGAATEELVSVTAVAGTTLTVVRGYGSTSAQSHSLGAVVRHVYDATDATDFRTHEAATAAIHGVSGTLVGTSDTQTLSNKTLTSPTINAGALSGTFTGSPTLSGNVAFSGTPTFSGAVAFTGAPVFSGSPSFTGTMQSTLALATTLGQTSKVNADTNDRYRRYADGKQEWGSGSAALDTNLYRSGVDTLATDDSLSVGGALAVTGDITAGTTGWTAFTPTYIATSVATSTNVGWYKKIGKIVFIEIYTAWSASGAGSTGVQVNLPSTPYRAGGSGANTSRQVIHGWIDNVGGVNLSNGTVIAPIFAGDTDTRTGTIRDATAGICQNQNIQSGTILTIQGWYREA